MSVMSMIYSFLFMPLQILFEVVYSYACRIVGNNYGLAIVALSLAINLLILPLYNRADKIQEEERDTEAKLSKGVAHIKKTFHGDERTMMLQTYYRQNNYSPLHSLRSATSLFLEIPFFIAAYSFLSGLSLLKGTSFGPIADLGAQDALLTIGSISINVLPILMTVLNVISTVIFTKNSATKTKVQLYAMAAFFLVLLYNSPSGLVFYWTLNNLFSLVKTIFYKLKDPKKHLINLSLIAGICSVGFGLFYMIGGSSERSTPLLIIGLFMCVPKLLGFLGRKKSLPKISGVPNKKLFFACTVFLASLTGLLIPSAVISASPQEFLNSGVYLHPVWYIAGSALIAAGTFILWMGVFYHLFSDKAKVIFERILVVTCILAVVNYMFFSRSLGLISPNLIYSNTISFSVQEKLINFVFLAVIIALIYFVSKLKLQFVRGLIVIATVAVCVMSSVNVFGICQSVAQVDETHLFKKSDSIISLSKNDKNVIVFMLDRAMGEYVPFIFEEYPELKEQYAGFTYYSNTASFGGHTNFASPALFGGYEYTPIEMNKRDDEPLVEKHNEALKVMPVLFKRNGFNVTVCDPPYAGYSEIPDLSIYDEYPEIETYITQGMFFDDDMRSDIISLRQRNFFCHSLFKIFPVFMQSELYDDGAYHQFDTINEGTPQYNVLKNLTKITSADSDKGSFIMIDNDTTHSDTAFPDPSYIGFDDERVDGMIGTSLSAGGKTLPFESTDHVYSFQNNAGALKKIGEWLDYLKEQGVYDNTRIIIVSDHGFSMEQMKELIFGDSSSTNIFNQQNVNDLEFYYPLLLVKDFDSREFQVSDEFMTNADVPTIATKDVIDDPVNPFTGIEINNDEKYAHEQYIIASNDWIVSRNDGNTFNPARWYSVHDSIWDLDNWELVAEDAVLP